MKKYLCFVIVIMVLLVFGGCSTDETSATPTQAPTIVIGEYEEDVFEIETDYCILKYPNRWKDTVQFTVADNKVSLKEKTTGAQIFDIVFGEGEGDTLGTLKTDKGDVAVALVSYEFDSKSDEYDTLCAMAEDINVIINHLVTDYSFKLA